MLSTQNILLPANGFPIAVPRRTWFSGLLRTYANDDFEEPRSRRTSPPTTRRRPPTRRVPLKIHDKVLFRRDGGRMETTLGRVLFNENVEQTLRDYLGDAYDPEEYEFVNHVLKKGEIKALVQPYVDRYPTELVSQLLDTLKRVGFHTATRAGISVGKNDIVVPEQKDEILERYEAMVDEVEEQWD